MEAYENNIFVEFNKILVSGQKEAVKINRTFKYIRKSTSTLSKYLKNKISDQNIIDKIDLIQRNTTLIWELATNSYNYDDEIIYEIKLELMNLDFEINDLIINLKVS